MHRLTARLVLLLLSCVLLAACSPAPHFRGKLILVFFGYVHCPDVCPTSLAAMNEVLNGMTPEERARIQPILISVDPARDTPESLKNYAAYFHPSLIGVTGTPEQIAALAKAFGAGSTLPYGAPADDLRAAIRKAL